MKLFHKENSLIYKRLRPYHLDQNKVRYDRYTGVLFVNLDDPEVNNYVSVS